MLASSACLFFPCLGWGTDWIYSLTGADTVIFYDSDFNPQMDRQCEDRYSFFLGLPTHR